VLAADGRGIVIACGAGALRVTELQKPGSKRLPAADFLRGSAVVVGQRFDGAP
jgi:methionyl-tRNA formyltransferase